MAGYDAQMEELLDTNPGLRSRFPTVLHFEDFSVEENGQILAEMLANGGYSVSCDPEAEAALAAKVAEATDRGSGNARTMRNLAEQLIRSHARRVADTEPTDSTIEVTDIVSAKLPYKIEVPSKRRGIGF